VAEELSTTLVGSNAVGYRRSTFDYRRFFTQYLPWPTEPKKADFGKSWPPTYNAKLLLTISPFKLLKKVAARRTKKEASSVIRNGNKW